MFRNLHKYFTNVSGIYLSTTIFLSSFVTKNLTSNLHCIQSTNFKLFKSNCISSKAKCDVMYLAMPFLVRDSSAVRRHYISLLELWNVRELYIRKTVDLPLRLWVGTFPRFVAIRFYFLSETLT